MSPAKLPTSCPACGAPIAPKPDTDGFKCDYCHAVFFPGEEDDGVVLPSQRSVSEYDCPLCAAALVHASIDGIFILYCTECRGLLMPMNVLPGLIGAVKENRDHAAVQTPPDAGDLKRTIECPKCHCRMDTHAYAGPGNVIVDNCGDCWLIWLDRGELTRIAHAPDEDSDKDSDW